MTQVEMGLGPTAFLGFKIYLLQTQFHLLWLYQVKNNSRSHFK